MLRGRSQPEQGAALPPQPAVYHFLRWRATARRSQPQSEACIYGLTCRGGLNAAEIPQPCGPRCPPLRNGRPTTQPRPAPPSVRCSTHAIGVQTQDSKRRWAPPNRLDSNLERCPPKRPADDAPIRRNNIREPRWYNQQTILYSSDLRPLDAHSASGVAKTFVEI